MRNVRRSRRAREEAARNAAALTFGHGVFNLAGGLWPLVHLRSFEWVFGPKTDRWLQRTVGGLLVGAGVSQIAGSATAEGRAHARRIGMATALTLLSVDLAYVPRGRIRPTYLLDGAMEVAWITTWLRRARAAD